MHTVALLYTLPTPATWPIWIQVSVPLSNVVNLDLLWLLTTQHQAISQSMPTHSSYSEGDHCPLRLSGLSAAHTFFWVIPQGPAPYFTVHSVGCLQPTPSSEWFLKARTLFHLALSDSSKPAPHFTVLSLKCNWSRIQSKKSCTHQDSVKKILPAVQFVS